MECVILQGHDPRWDEFVAAHAAGTFFHLSAWREILKNRFGYDPVYVLAQDEQRLCAVLPLFLVRSWLFGRSLVAMPVGVYGGILANSNVAGRLLLDKAMSLAKEYRVRYLELRGNPFVEFDMETTLNGSAASWARKNTYVTFVGEIDATDEDNLSRIPRKQRRMVRQGNKHGLKAIFDNRRLPEFYQVYAESVRNLGTPVYSYSYFKNLTETFDDKCKVLVIEHEGRVIAGVLSFFYRDQVLPYYGGALKESLSVAPNDFMYWELMRHAAATGYKIFDFGRSKEGTGSFNFKRHWGFEPKPLPYWCYSPDGLSIPDTSPLNPKLQWAIRLWRELPLSVTKTLGPHIVKHIP